LDCRHGGKRYPEGEQETAARKSHKGIRGKIKPRQSRREIIAYASVAAIKKFMGKETGDRRRETGDAGSRFAEAID
jgi:hypothetical protein